MTADEYDDLIAEPEAFMLRAFMPRIFGALEGLQKMPLFLGAGFDDAEIPNVRAF